MVEVRPPKSSNFYRAHVTARVKWFDPAKGIGFVTPEDGSADAFLHVSRLGRAGVASVSEGATVVCDIGPGQKGPQVAEVHSVDESTARPKGGRGRRSPETARPPARAARPARPQQGPSATSEFGRTVEGTVKFFDKARGFGFVTPDRSSKDVFVPMAALKRSGIEALQPHVRVRLYLRQTDRGIEAEKVEFP